MIKIQGLYKSYKETEVLKDISISIENKDIFGIIGHSGAGKSTLLRCINGLESFDKGRVFIEDREITTLSNKDIRSLRKDLGMIFQNFNLVSRDTVYNNIALPLKVWGYDKSYIDKKVKDLLNIVGLQDKAKVKPKSLSGGQKQRVAIARALALEPKILLCDEATSALDPKTTKDILHLLKDINKDLGITIVIVTHQMEVIKEVCNKVALIEHGEVLYSGDSQDLFLKPNKDLKEFLGDDSDVTLDGVNIKIFFPSSISKSSIITSMARELDVDFSIIGGKLEKFRDEILGTLIINFDDIHKESIETYLNNKNIDWEVVI
ncbi:methionine ABC transporter ATP-binding protein [Clostridium hydrogeniformans]|uniref:methionine ABC transporter ATP-binding protein n=1 Tax=Clostridium hydrogeniformans TaxID=349933 RepID=UPI0004815784|nr:methionine ABC transporter ATP-binding protein [Clostridium hydrogeniformans]